MAARFAFTFQKFFSETPRLRYKNLVPTVQAIPKSSCLLAFLRRGLALFGYSMLDSEGFQNYGTHSLRLGAAH